jgi:25-hydroxyvitamin D3 1alpha-hydroxylase
MMHEFIDKHQTNPVEDCVLSKLLSAEGEKLTRDQIAGNMKGLFVAGIDTTGSTLGWALYHLGQQPKLQDQIVAELSSEASGVNCMHDLKKLHLIQALWAETSRLRTPAPLNFLSNTEPITIAGRLVPAGTNILLAMRYAENSSPEIQALGTDIHAFRPERWMLDGQFNQSAANNLSTFGHGTHACLGRRLAELEGQLALAEVIRKFKIECSPVQVGEVTAAVQRPDRDIELTVVPRAVVLTRGAAAGA